MKIKHNEELLFVLSIAAAIMIFSFILFGTVGLRVIIGIILMSLPFYLLLGRFNLDTDERYVFSLLIGITLFPSIVYLFGLVISFRFSIILTFILLIIIFFITRKSKKN